MTHSYTQKPHVVLMMRPHLVDQFFDDKEWARLAAVAHVLSREAFESLQTPSAHALLGQADVVLAAWGAPRLDAAFLAAAPRLKLVAYGAASVRGIVTPEFWQTGIKLTSAVSAMAVPVAEFTFAAIIMSGKDVFRIRDAHRRARGTEGFGLSLATEDLRIWGNHRRKIGIVGASRTGRLVISMLRFADFEVGVYDPFLSDAEARALSVQRMKLPDLMAWSDTVSLHAPILPETRHMIDAAALSRMHDGAILINTARGWLVDHEALLSECRSGRLSAWIDTPDPEPLPPDSPFFDLPNVVLTPHIAGSLGNELKRQTAAAIDEIERFAMGLPLETAVLESALDRIA